MAATTFAVNPNSFAKCAPNISTNIRQCGTVTQCNAKPVTQDELASLYLKSGDFRVMDALFKHDIEIKMCESLQNGIYDFFMANKIVTNKNIQSRRTSAGVLEIAPFILARQYSQINNQYWKFSSGTTAGASHDYKVIVSSPTNIPADVALFGAKERVFLHGKSQAGSVVEKMYEIGAGVNDVVNNGDGTITLELIDRNAGSQLDADKIGAFGGAPGAQTGLLRRGTPNVNKYEKYCNEAPTYLNWKNVPFWVESTRHSMCWSSLYQKWKRLVLEGNMLYDEFFNLEETQKNKQLGRDWQDRVAKQIFWGKGLPYQTADAYDLLDDITSFDGSAFFTGGGSAGLGVDGGKCVGKRASMVGIYEQMAQCGRVYDAQGATLNLISLFTEMYNMMRVREGSGRKNARQFDVFTDSTTAELINQGMIAYYIAKSNNTLRFNMPAEGYPANLSGSQTQIAKKADFGFYYNSYPLFWPQGVHFNVLWHEFFDDYISAAQSVMGANDNTARVLWVLDFAGIYPGIISSTRKVHKTGDLQTLAAVSSAFACVMEVPTQEQTLIETVMTVIVECPKGNLVLENFNNSLPIVTPDANTSYPGTHTSTTTTTQTPFTG